MHTVSIAESHLTVRGLTPAEALVTGFMTRYECTRHGTFRIMQISQQPPVIPQRPATAYAHSELQSDTVSMHIQLAPNPTRTVMKCSGPAHSAH